MDEDQIMKLLTTILALCSALVLGVMLDRIFIPVPPIIAMPIHVTDEDVTHLIVLESRAIGTTYKRLATIDGNPGIVAVRHDSGTWLIPCQEVGKEIVGGKK